MSKVNKKMDTSRNSGRYKKVEDIKKIHTKLPKVTNGNALNIQDRSNK